MNAPHSSDNALPVRPGDVLAEKYRVERVLGTGGMGFVVAARIIGLGKLVALKMMLPAALAMPRAVERFEREARAAVQLKSEHVAEVLDIGRLPSGLPYIVMEMLDGSDFEGLLKKERWLHVEDVVGYMLQACEAVSEAHALGVVHRDLKPKNLFLSHRLDGTPLVKVLDFGISKWTTTDPDSQSLTRTSDVFGSPNYMSPEQIRSVRDVDGRTDIWSLGVILFELLTGRVPFLAESLPQLCALVLETPAPAVSTLRADVPPGLTAIVARCLEKSPERRFQTVHELVSALEPFGPARPPPRMNDTGRSPGASTMPFRAPPPAAAPAAPAASGAPPPDASVRVLVSSSSGTNSSWGATMFDGQRGRQRIIGGILVATPVLLVAAGITLWLLVQRGTFAHGPTHTRDGSAAATASVAVTVPIVEPPASVAVTSDAPPASVAPEVTSAIAKPPASTPPRGPPRTLSSARSAASAAPPAPPRSATPAPTGDPFTPGDRK